MSLNRVVQTKLKVFNSRCDRPHGCFRLSSELVVLFFKVVVTLDATAAAALLLPPLSCCSATVLTCRNSASLFRLWRSRENALAPLLRDTRELW